MIMNLNPTHSRSSPPMDDERLKELTQDIKERDRIEPIVLYEGRILDGRNRYLSCRMAGTEPMTVEFSQAENSRNPVE